MPRSPEEEQQPLPDEINGDFFLSGRESAESLESIDYELQLQESLVDEGEEEVDDANGFGEEMEIDEENGHLEEMNQIDDDDNVLNLEDNLHLAEDLHIEDGIDLDLDDNGLAELPGDLVGDEEDDGLDSDHSSDMEGSGGEEEDDDEDDADDRIDEDEREASEEEEEIRIRPMRSKRLRRSGEHHLGDDSKSVGCRLPTNLEIREGHEYQVHVDDYVEEEQGDGGHETNREKCLWKPMLNSNPSEIDEYCDYCEARYSMHRDRSLFVLRMAGYDFEKAKHKCEVRSVIHDEWSQDDKWLFQQCITNFGKNFSKIRNAMPHKSVSALVQNYYNTKKGVNYKSFFDVDNILIDEVSSDESGDEETHSKDIRSETKEETPDVLEEGIEVVEEIANADSDSEEEVICTNCQEYVNKLFEVDEFKLCTTCFYYLKATNMMRPSQELNSRKRIKLPEDMVDIVDEFHRHALKADEPIYDIEGDDDDEVRVYSKCTYIVDEELRAVQRDLQGVQRKLAQLHAERQLCEFKFRTTDGDVTRFREISSNAPVVSKTTPEWTQREMVIAFHTLSLYHNDYLRAAALIRTKNDLQVKEFIGRHTDQLNEFMASTSNGAGLPTGEEPSVTLRENGNVEEVPAANESPVANGDESSEDSDRDDFLMDDFEDVNEGTSRSPSLSDEDEDVQEFNEQRTDNDDEIIAI